eukprot:scaffold149404_cov20-Tisochrysis_lutea.AAC.2
MEAAAQHENPGGGSGTASSHTAVPPGVFVAHCWVSKREGIEGGLGGNAGGEGGGEGGGRPGGGAEGGAGGNGGAGGEGGAGGGLGQKTSASAASKLA